MATMTFSQVQIINLTPNAAVNINVDASTIWKIESAGLGGTKGTIYLLDDHITPRKIAMLYSSVDQDNYGSPMPFWISDFDGKIVNESNFQGCVSVTVYSIP
jgi:hypothetical protein